MFAFTSLVETEAEKEAIRETQHMKGDMHGEALLEQTGKPRHHKRVCPLRLHRLAPQRNCWQRCRGPAFMQAHGIFCTQGINGTQNTKIAAKIWWEFASKGITDTVKSSLLSQLKLH